jgi:hypothetical protein
MGERHTRHTPVRLFFALMAPTGDLRERCEAAPHNVHYNGLPLNAYPVVVLARVTMIPFPQ